MTDAVIKPPTVQNCLSIRTTNCHFTLKVGKKI